MFDCGNLWWISKQCRHILKSPGGLLAQNCEGICVDLGDAHLLLPVLHSDGYHIEYTHHLLCIYFTNSCQLCPYVIKEFDALRYLAFQLLTRVYDDFRFLALTFSLWIWKFGSTLLGLLPWEVCVEDPPALQLLLWKRYSASLHQMLHSSRQHCTIQLHASLGSKVRVAGIPNI